MKDDEIKHELLKGKVREWRQMTTHQLIGHAFQTSKVKVYYPFCNPYIQD